MRSAQSLFRHLFLPKDLAFRCNICGAACRARRATLTREAVSCPLCGSWPRIRSIVHVLSVEMFGTSLALPDFPIRRDLAGIGLSDWDGLSALAEKLNYVNTTFDGKGTHLDICHVGSERDATLDFVIASEVFEHVEPPVSRAFENVFRMLKPGGVLVLSVPYRPNGVTIEHFADLHQYQIVEERGAKVLVNVTVDGRTERFDRLVFHGGEGATLEMRQFTMPSLLDECARAGFSDVRINQMNHLEHGIFWPQDYSRPLAARK